MTENARYPLPDGVDDCLLNKREVGELLGVSQPTLDAWIRRDGLPFEEEGTNGREWSFRASSVWAWKCARDDGERLRAETARATVEALRLKLVGGKVGDTEMALDPTERARLYAVQRTHYDMMEAAKRLLPRADVEEALADILSLVRDALGAQPDLLEREAGLTAKAVDLVIKANDDLLELMARRIGEFFAARPVTQPKDRPDLFQ